MALGAEGRSDDAVSKGSAICKWVGYAEKSRMHDSNPHTTLNPKPDTLNSKPCTTPHGKPRGGTRSGQRPRREAAASDVRNRGLGSQSAALCTTQGFRAVSKQGYYLSWAISRYSCADFLVTTC